MRHTGLSGKEFGILVKSRRDTLGLTQERVIEKMNRSGTEFSQPFLSQIENGRFKPGNLSMDRLTALCYALQITIHDLV